MKLTALKGITEKREKDLNKLNIFEAEDLVRFYPRAYLDLTERSSLRTAYHNDMVLAACEVVRVAPVNYMSRLKTVKVYCNQDGLPFVAVWFNQPYIRDKIKPGEYLLYGRVQNKYGQISIVNPSFEPLEQNSRLKGIVPVYPLKGSLTQKIVRNAVAEALKKVAIDSVIPRPVAEKYGCPPWRKAFSISITRPISRRGTPPPNGWRWRSISCSSPRSRSSRGAKRMYACINIRQARRTSRRLPGGLASSSRTDRSGR